MLTHVTIKMNYILDKQDKTDTKRNKKAQVLYIFKNKSLIKKLTKKISGPDAFCCIVTDI